MKKAPGVLESLAMQFAKVLEPLEDRLTTREIRLLFAELGLQFPIELEAKQAFLDALQNSVRQALQLPDLISDLIEAIDSDDPVAILDKTKSLLTTLKSLVESIDTIASELRNLSDAFPDISTEDIQDFTAVLPERLLAYLIATHIDSKSPVITEFLEFWGIIQRSEEPGDPANPAKPSFTLITLHLARAIDLLESPSTLARTLYKWGAPDFDGSGLLQALSKSFTRLNVPVILETSSTPNILDFVFAQLAAKTDISPPGLSLAFTSSGNLPSVSLRDGSWRLDLGLDFVLPTTGDIFFQPNGMLALQTSDRAVSGKAFLHAIGASPDPNQPFLLFGQSSGSRLQAQEVKVAFETELNFDADAGLSRGELLFEASVKNGVLFISPVDGDRFLTSVLPSEGFQAGFEFTIGYSSETGFFFNGSGALEINIPVHVSIGSLDLQSVTLDISFDDGTLRVDLGATLKLGLGPLIAVIRDIGLNAEFSLTENGGNLGPLNLNIGFKPPTAIGISIDSGGFKGGGFLDFEPEEERYSGILELEYQDQFTLKAFGLLTTRLPNGQSGFSLLIVISSEFTPIQLGFGFKLNGVGGLLGLNRTVLTEPLRAGLRDNTLSSILFPTDIIANADRILSDLRQVFPPQNGRFVFGPMAKITWGTPTLLTVDLGLVIEIPEPVRLVILGVVRGILPDEQASILRLQVNFLGEINFEQQQLSFDASLFDSKILGYTLTGDMALRLYWGAEANFLLTVGGFHPAYQPPPMNLPALRRLTLALLQGDNPRLTLEMYFAVTSNTVQFGARLELYAAAWKFNVYGFLSFDVLFQFNPFYFVADITAMLALRVGTSSIASIELALTLEGPTPWRAKGTAKFRICWFFTLKIRFNKTFGEARNTTLPDLAVLPLLLAALSAPDNWEGELPARKHRLESLKEVAALEQIFVHPLGTLKISQKVVPLNLRIDRLGSQRPSDAREFRIRDVTPGVNPTPIQESFAPAQFFDMNDEEKLASPSFKNFDSGVRIGEPERLHTAYAAARKVQYELKYIDSQRDRRLEPQQGLFEIDPLAFNTWTLQGAVAKSELAFARRRKSSLAPEEVAVVQEPFAIVNTGDLRLFDETSLLGSERAALTRVNALIATNPALRGSLQVVPAFEANP